jgi:polyhydroxyalkanoate synthesis repressor PhaR
MRESIVQLTSMPLESIAISFAVVAMFASLITRSILQQIVAEEEKKSGQDLLPIAFTRGLIGFYGDAMQEMVSPYLERSMETLTREREKLQG